MDLCDAKTSACDGAPSITVMASEASSAATTLETLLDLQGHDLNLDRLRHLRDGLPERARLAELDHQLGAVDQQRAVVGAQRDEVAGQESRLDDEASSLEARAAAEEARLYSGEVSSPKELQAMQRDITQLRRQRAKLEDRELELMERREALDAQLAVLGAAVESARTQSTAVQERLAEQQRDLDAEIAGEESARAGRAEQLEGGLLADYERRRALAHGVGAARLVGGTCQGCHLSIPAIEAEQVRRAEPGTIAHCDNCGAILVP